MRPLAIWGMQFAWENIVPQKLKDQMGDGSITTLEERSVSVSALRPEKKGGAPAAGRGGRRVRKVIFYFYFHFVNLFLSLFVFLSH